MPRNPACRVWRPGNAWQPPVNTGLLDGELAWRQYDGGHEDRSNMKRFLAWATRMLDRPPIGLDTSP
ncbi:MAG: hypothetical protein KJ072_06470 [Verrucomicrobia bacterium]|nr:hypothetical protein [Verrucomicrobiota bacterium]